MERPTLVLVVLALLLCSNPSFGGEPDGPSVEPAHGEARGLFKKSLAQRFDTSSAERITMIRHFKTQEEEMKLESARKLIDGRMHSIVRIGSPEEYRGWRVLTIEAHQRSDDHFIFMRSQGKVRRVRALPADSFFGTDFTLEDMERRSIDDFRIVSIVESVYEGEPVYVVAVIPSYETRAARLEFVIAKGDASQLAIRSYRTGAAFASKEVLFPRDSIRLVDHIPVATHIIARNLHRKTETHAHIDEIAIAPELPNSLFSVNSLHSDRPIPGLMVKGDE